MFRVLSLITFLAVSAAGYSSAVAAAPFASLDQASQTATVERDGVQVIAFYRKRDALLDLTILITDHDGEALRTRIGLRDRQHHTVVLPTSDDKTPDARIEFLRIGERVEMIFSTAADLAKATGTKTSVGF